MYHGQAEKDSHALAIGRIVIAWNNLQEELAHIFGKFFSEDDWSLALASWHALDNDRAQRAMLRAVARERLNRDSHGFKELLWLLGQTDNSISAQRNIGIHAPLFSLTEEDGTHKMVPGSWFGNRNASALEGKDILKEYAHYELQIRQLTTYAVMLQFNLSTEEPVAWPERPTIPTKA